MISAARVKRLFAYLLPLLGPRTSKAELDKTYAEIEKILGYDASKASRIRADAKDRDVVVDALMAFSLARANGPAGGGGEARKKKDKRMSRPDAGARLSTPGPSAPMLAFQK